MTLKLRNKYISKSLFKLMRPNGNVYTKCRAVWLLSLTYVYFSIKFRITFYTWMKNILDLNLFLYLFFLFVIRKMKLLYTFFTLAIKQNLFSLDSKSYCTQKNFFHKIRHWVLSLFFSDNKQNFEIINICILYLSIICLNPRIQEKWI